MANVKVCALSSVLICLTTLGATAQSFRVQCPTSTITHPVQILTNGVSNNPALPLDSNAEPPYTGPSTLTINGSGYLAPTANVNGAIKCQQVSGGDGYATMADGTQTFMFSFGPLSGLADIAAGQPGTEFPNVFNTQYPYSIPLRPGDPATTDGATDYSNGAPGYAAGTGGFTWNGAVGLTPDIPFLDTIYDISEVGNSVTVVLNGPVGFAIGDQVVISGTGTPPAAGPYDGTFTVSAVGVSNPFFASNFAFQFVDKAITGGPDVNASTTATAASVPGIDGHVDPRQIMDVGVMNGNIPAPLIAFDEDDELFLTLTNVGMIMRPDRHRYENRRPSTSGSV